MVCLESSFSLVVTVAVSFYCDFLGRPSVVKAKLPDVMEPELGRGYLADTML